MDMLGLFSLGCFVGTLATFGLRFIKDAETWKQGLTTMIASTLSGTAILFVERFRTSGALGAYSLGLLIALLWTYSDEAVYKINAQTPQADATNPDAAKNNTAPGMLESYSYKFLGYAHLVFIVIASAIALMLVLPPAFKDVWGMYHGQPAASQPAQSK